MGISDKTAIGDAELKKAFGLLKSVEELTLPLAMALVAVAREPGLSITQLAERMEVPQQTASRYAATLLGRFQYPTSADFARNPLLSLEVSSSDPRSRALYLPAHGKRRS